LGKGKVRGTGEKPAALELGVTGVPDLRKVHGSPGCNMK